MRLLRCLPWWCSTTWVLPVAEPTAVFNLENDVDLSLHYLLGKTVSSVAFCLDEKGQNVTNLQFSDGSLLCFMKDCMTLDIAPPVKAPAAESSTPDSTGPPAS